MIALRVHPIHIRLTEDEYQALSQKASKAGVSLSSWVRRAALEQEIPSKREEIDVNLYKELTRIGVNINQLARAANTAVNMGDCPQPTPEQWQELYDLLKRLTLEVIG
jgi:hypothetical protein